MKHQQEQQAKENKPKAQTTPKIYIKSYRANQLWSQLTDDQKQTILDKSPEAIDLYIRKIAADKFKEWSGTTSNKLAYDLADTTDPDAQYEILITRLQFDPQSKNELTKNKTFDFSPPTSETLNELAEEFEEQYEESFDLDYSEDVPGTPHQTNLILRSEALISLANDRAKHSYVTAKLSDSITEKLKALNLDPQSYKYFVGDQTQRQLHKEHVELLNLTSDLTDQYPDNETVNFAQPTIFEFTDIARQYNVIGKLEKSYTVTDFCWDIFDYTSAAC